jgi:outer membrane receptor protein involved in Fe transport
LVAALSLLLLAPPAVLAQTTGTIEGSVTDQSGAALPGVTVEIASPNLQGTRTAVTAANGRYRFPSLPPGVYTVTGSLSGFTKVPKKATVTLDAVATVDLLLTLSTTAEVTVTGEAPLVDKTSSTAGTNYTASIIDKLPVGRNYADVVFLQPGVQADFGETQGRSLAISIYGSTSAENLFLIDGVNTTNVIKGFQGKDINNEFVQEVEVKTGGYQAEYGRNTGGVINVITKSGGNQFHGGAFGYYNDTGMRAYPVNGEPRTYGTPDYSETGVEQPGNSILSKDVRQEWGLDLGGFAVKDRVWFFGAYDRVQVNQNIQTLDITNPETFGARFPTSYVENKYAGKITLNLSQGTSVVGTVFSDAQTQLGALQEPSSLDALSYAGRLDLGSPDYGARLSQLFGSFGIFTFQYARHQDRYHLTPDGYATASVCDFTVSPNGTYCATDIPPTNPGYPSGYGYVSGTQQNNQSRRQSYAGAFAAYFGNHELKAGVDYQDDDTFGATYFTGGSRVSVRPCLQDGGANQCDLSKAPSWVNANGDRTQVFFQHALFATGTNNDFQVAPNAPFDAQAKRYSAFLQDQWRILPTLTVNLGVRYDTESYFGFDTTLGQVKAFSLANQWAPRIGVVWDFVGDGTSKLYASAGRFYYALPTDLTALVFTFDSMAVTFNYDFYSIAQNAAAPQQQIFRQTGGGFFVDSALKASYQDELTVGVEKALDPTLLVGLKGTYRTLGRVIEDRDDLNTGCPACAPSSVALFNPGSAGPIGSGYYPTCNSSGNPTDSTAGTCTTATNSGVPDGPASRYFRGIELTARKQFTNQIWAQFSFLYSSLIGNYSGAVHESTGQTDPGVNSDFDYYQFYNNAYGRLELDRPVQARIDAVYNAPFGISAGLGFYVRSGLPTSRIGWFNSGYGMGLQLDPRGSDGRTPTDYEMNLSLGYNWNVGPVTVTPMLYFFNLLNRQTPDSVDENFNPNGSVVTNPASPFYGQAGIEPGTTASCPASAQAPCTDNPDYRKVTGRGNPRLLQAALKITF